jgi:hypothetical protein
METRREKLSHQSEAYLRVRQEKTRRGELSRWSHTYLRVRYGDAQRETLASRVSYPPVRQQETRRRESCVAVLLTYW